MHDTTPAVHSITTLRVVARRAFSCESAQETSDGKLNVHPPLETAMSFSQKESIGSQWRIDWSSGWETVRRNDSRSSNMNLTKKVKQNEVPNS